MGLRDFIGNVFSKSYTALAPTNSVGKLFELKNSNKLSVLDISLYTSKAIEKRAEKVSEIEFTLKNAKGDDISAKNDIFNLLYKPNKFFTGTQFWKLYQTYYDVFGEAFIYKERAASFGAKQKIVALHLLMPNAVEIVFDEDTGIITGFKLQKTNTLYSVEDIIYVRNPDPSRPLRGQSILRAGIQHINTEINLVDYQSRVLKNGGRIEGVFKFTSKLNKTQVEELKASYKEGYAEAKRAGMPLFLGDNAEYIRTGLAPEELAYLESKKATLEDICIMTSVPRSMLGSTNDVKFDNAEADRSIFLRETISPLQKILTTALNEDSLIPEDEELGFVDPAPENTEMNLKRAESGVKSYYITPNEARKITGFDPIEGGDALLIPFNLMPSEAPTAQQQKMLTKDASGWEKHPLKDLETRMIYHEAQIKRMDARERKFIPILKKYLDDQMERILSYAEKANKRSRKNLIDEWFNMGLEIEYGKRALVPILLDFLRSSGQSVQENVGTGYDFIVADDMVSWLQSRSDIFLRQINETTFKELQKQFQENIENEGGRLDLIERIKTTYGLVKQSRAQTIARTEVHNVTQYGTMRGYQQAGVSIKIWVSVMDKNTRHSHAELDGEERPLGVAFSNGLMFPGDPAGSAEEVINCRCVI